MGYTLHYRATGDTPIGASALAALHAHAAEVSASLSRTAEAFAWRVVEGATEASGWTKPGLDLPDLERDVEVVVAAMEQVARILGGWEVTLTDDFDSELYRGRAAPGPLPPRKRAPVELDLFPAVREGIAAGALDALVDGWRFTIRERRGSKSLGLRGTLDWDALLASGPTGDVARLVEALAHGRVTVPGVGAFELVETEGRVGRNPGTGREIAIPGKTLIRFRAVPVE